MSLKKAPRSPEELEPIRLFQVLGGGAAKPGSPFDREGFLETVKASVERSLANEGRLHGLRTEALFGELVVALGGVRMLTSEDAGQVFFDDEEAQRVIPPDFRIVRSDGTAMLVEVKGVEPSKKRFAIRGHDWEAYVAYARLSDTPLYFALYWPRWNIWTLVPADALKAAGSKRVIHLNEAIVVNELGTLGDVMLGAKPPLELRLQMTSEKPIEAGNVEATITAVSIAQAGQTLSDATETAIAWTLLQFGSWPVRDVSEQTSESTFDVTFICEPSEHEPEVAAQGFAIVGYLSSLYSSLFNQATLDDEGRVVALGREPVPGFLGTLVPLDYHETPHDLKLWMFRVAPRASE